MFPAPAACRTVMSKNGEQSFFRSGSLAMLADAPRLVAREQLGRRALPRFRALGSAVVARAGS